jgi:ketosteroid isomerase-like protein
VKASALELASRFARALDQGDYDIVRALLAPDCHYETRTGPIFGADAIVDSYRDAGKTARSLFDNAEYQSALLGAKADSADISFSDRLSKDGRQHVYRCRQRLFFNPGALISRIVHEELPGERQRLLEFCAGCGINLTDANPGRSGSA